MTNLFLLPVLKVGSPGFRHRVQEATGLTYTYITPFSECSSHHVCDATWQESLTVAYNCMLSAVIAPVPVEVLPKGHTDALPLAPGESYPCLPYMPVSAKYACLCCTGVPILLCFRFQNYPTGHTDHSVCICYTVQMVRLHKLALSCDIQHGGGTCRCQSASNRVHIGFGGASSTLILWCPCQQLLQASGQKHRQLCASAIIQGVSSQQTPECHGCTAASHITSSAQLYRLSGHRGCG